MYVLSVQCVCCVCVSLVSGVCMCARERVARYIDRYTR